MSDAARAELAGEETVQGKVYAQAENCLPCEKEIDLIQSVCLATISKDKFRRKK